MQNNKIHRHKEEIQKRIQNIQKKIQNNSGAGSTPSTAITTNRRQHILNNDKYNFSRNIYAHKSVYEPSADTRMENGQNNTKEAVEVVGGRRTFSYAEQDYNQTGHILRQKYQRPNLQEKRIQRQKKDIGEDMKQKNNKYLNQYMTIISPQSKSYGRANSIRKNSSQNVGVIVPNKQNSKIKEQNTSLRPVQKQVKLLTNHNMYNRQDIPQSQELRKNIQLEEILKEVVSNQRKLQNQVLQLKTQLEKQSECKQIGIRHYKSSINQNSQCVYGRESYPNHQNQYFNTKTMKLTEYVPRNNNIKNKNMQEMSHDPYMVTNNMTNPTLTNNETEYNYDRVVRMIKQKESKKNKISDKQKLIKIQDEEQIRPDYKSEPKKQHQPNSNIQKDKLKKNILKQKLYSIVKVGKPNTERYVVPESNKQIFFEQLKNRMEQSELEYTDIMHRNNRFQHERLISANQLQKKIRDNALAIIYQQCNKCVYK